MLAGDTRTGTAGYGSATDFPAGRDPAAALRSRPMSGTVGVARWIGRPPGPFPRRLDHEPCRHHTANQRFPHRGEDNIVHSA